MGTSHSRVSPSQTIRIFDCETRARLQNQREAAQLRQRLVQLKYDRTDSLSQWNRERHELKTKLTELRHESNQRRFFKTMTQHNDEDDGKKNISELVEVNKEEDEEEDGEFDENSSSNEVKSTILLLYDLQERMKQQKENINPNDFETSIQNSKSWVEFQQRQAKYSSMLNKIHDPFFNPKAAELPQNRKLIAEWKRQKLLPSDRRANRNSSKLVKTKH